MCEAHSNKGSSLCVDKNQPLQEYYLTFSKVLEICEYHTSLDNLLSTVVG